MTIEATTYVQCDCCKKYNINFPKPLTNSGGEFVTVGDGTKLVSYLFCADCAKKFNKMIEDFTEW